jgi:hypothetical protein
LELNLWQQKSFILNICKRFKLQNDTYMLYNTYKFEYFLNLKKVCHQFFIGLFSYNDYHIIRDEKLCCEHNCAPKKHNFSLFWILFYIGVICFRIGISWKSIKEHKISKIESIILHLYILLKVCQIQSIQSVKIAII